jgi:hypothetical protein
VSRRHAATVVVLFVTLLGQSGARAHGSEDHPTGTLAVPAAGSASLAVEDIGPGETLQWMWEPRSGGAGHLSTRLVWTDVAGHEQASPADPPGQTFGRFVAPRDLGGVRLVWQNTGDRPALVEWSYHASAPFWLRPDMFLPAMIPVLLLAACYAAAKALDRRTRRARARRERPGAIIAKERTHESQ